MKKKDKQDLDRKRRKKKKIPGNRRIGKGGEGDYPIDSNKTREVANSKILKE
ncbi:MAG: hypothetical protein ACE5WD_00570 [Candidatus Aminicenantia bacterium]